MRNLFIVSAIGIMFLLNLHFSAADNSACDYKVEIILASDAFDKDGFKWRMKATRLDGSPTNITGIATIESEGKAVKSYTPWNSLPIARQKTSAQYSPNLGPGDYGINAKISTQCDDNNPGNNEDAKKFTIKGDNAKDKSAKEKSTKIINTAATSSKKSGQNAIITERGIQEGNADVAPSEKQQTDKSVVSREIKNTVKSAKISLPENKGEKNKKAIANPIIPSSQVIYKSSGEKSKELIVLSLLMLSILLNVVLVWKR